MDELITANDNHPAEALVTTVIEQAAITSIALSSVVSLVVFSVVMDDVASAIAQVPLIAFKNSEVYLAPAVIMFFCASGLLRNFFAPQTSLAAKIMRAVLAGFLLVVSTSNGIGGLIVFLVGGAAWVAFCRLGLAMRRAMPPTFRYRRALTAAFIGNLPIMSFMAFITSEMMSSMAIRSNYGAIGDVSSSYLLFVTSFTSFIVALPAFLIAKSARTSDAKPLTLLAVLLNSPVILTLAAIPLSALFVSDLAPYYWPFILACLPMPIAAVLMTAGGAYVGAKSNALSHHLKQLKPEDSLKLKS